ncbi:hypothetical protein [Pseudomonas arsenicoxydans]|uniref:hypothetical protein n=1 Tax=Pseudomonas arsenicoxydans TaxID=702115 RepID=UPI00112703DD|nr:hypothetical protein [Pseudomonas arsenicoxydans]
MNEVNVPAQRKVGFLLLAGIIISPILFAWFLLRKGHSVLSRVIGFAWLTLCLLSTLDSYLSLTNEPAAPAAESISSSTSFSLAVPVETLKK